LDQIILVDSESANIGAVKINISNDIKPIKIKRSPIGFSSKKGSRQPTENSERNETDMLLSPKTNNQKSIHLSQSKNKNHLSPELVDKIKKAKEFNVIEIDQINTDSNSKSRKERESSKGGNVTVRDPTPALIKARSGAAESAILKSEPSKTEDQEKRKQLTS
jgi:hypothetical protein